MNLFYFKYTVNYYSIKNIKCLIHIKNNFIILNKKSLLYSYIKNKLSEDLFSNLNVNDNDSVFINYDKNIVILFKN